ncbi:MAG: hypothetical protein A4E52_01335 [Pelotomaculum sp. PtaB.Bin013]|uniref:Prepilin-type N-terminal cleavage/methylation domain-containing protein n=1 Tax=Pelotomaculum isophthalicicum JI TaxID=947010 RepID=A0A9X4H0E6_9FIRM|nr:prepilin-type N-terminal cleavage/methylation domain-containing protein [Pelotomaculum isophthalicicum]MDF9409772.1 prepilin-type N-terminal cleavage/methylation domain-containing protein [Pelotomaculum isophthalicicum JI]OPX87707.1 MAG: hypothetical protein A4E52_01335 [Pelotomaculum sp. PtaB.Bin013]
MHNRLRDNHGFTFVEVMMALAAIGMIMLAFVSYIGTHSKVDTDNLDQLRMSELAVSITEGIKGGAGICPTDGSIIDPVGYPLNTPAPDQNYAVRCYESPALPSGSALKVVVGPTGSDPNNNSDKYTLVSWLPDSVASTPIAQLMITPAAPSCRVGETTQLTVNLLDNISQLYTITNAPGITYTSSDTNVITVNNGLLTGTGAGSAVITVSYTIGNTTFSNHVTVNVTSETVTDPFISYLVNNNVFVYGSQFAFEGGNVNGSNATMVVQGNLDGNQLNGGAVLNVSNIYINGYCSIDGGSADLGSGSNPGSIYVNGNLDLLSGTRDIYGNVYVNGNFSLKDAHIHGNVYVNGNVALYWTPVLDANARIYYTGSLTYPNKYPASIIVKCIHQASVPTFTMPNYAIPPLKPDSWYAANGYVPGGNLANNIKIFADSYSFHDWRTYNNVIIVSKGDINLTGNITVTGVLFAPNGRVTFDGASFTGVVIAKNGFDVTSGGSTITFVNISNYINNVADYPFQ